VLVDQQVEHEVERVLARQLRGLGDAQALDIKLWVNGELRPNYNTSDLAHSIAESIAWATAITPVEPGDVLFMGTNHQGLGALQDGDTPLNIKEDGPPANGSNGGGEVALGKRYASPDGSVEVLCIKPGALDLKYNNQPMELMQPKVLPSAD